MRLYMLYISREKEESYPLMRIRVVFLRLNERIFSRPSNRLFTREEHFTHRGETDSLLIRGISPFFPLAARIDRV